MRSRLLPPLALWFALLILLAVSETARATSYFWVGPSGTWNNPANWSFSAGGPGGAGVPGPGDEGQAIGSSNKTVTYTSTIGLPGLTDFFVTSTNNFSTIQLNHNTGGMTANLGIVGSTGRGSYVLNTGTCTVSDLRIAANGVGTFTLNVGSGTNALTSDVIRIATSTGDTGLFQQNGGAITAGSIDIANASSANGTYVFAGGTLSAGSILLHPGGTFTNSSAVPIRFTGFNQSGGTHNYGPLLYIAQDPLSVGTYLLSAGTLIGQNCKPGYQGTGTFTQSGGVFTPLEISIGEGTTGIGRFFMSNTASLTTNNMYVGVYGNGTFIQTGGNINVTQIFTIVGRDPSGSGYFDQSGGTHTTAELHLGYFAGGKGTYALSGGTLTSNFDPIIGQTGSGTFIQSGGLFTTPGLMQIGSDFNSTGAYFLNGGTLNVTGDIYIAWLGSASFTQSSGVYNTPATTHLAQGSIATAIYTMTGGSFTSGSLIVGASGAGTFNQSGVSVVTVPLTLEVGSGTTALGRYSLDGGTLSVGDDITIGNFGAATFMQNSGVYYTEDSTYLARQTGSTALYTMTGGSFTSGSLTVGAAGSAAFNQSGGSLLAATLTVGASAGSSGRFNLSGPSSVGADNIILGVGGDGTFTQALGTSVHTSLSTYVGLNNGPTGYYENNGGTHQVNSLILANQPGSRGTYLLTDGTLTCFNGPYIGLNGAGTFIQSGGRLDTSVIVIAAGGMSSGTYLMSGGTVSILSGYIFVGNNAAGTVIQSGGLIAGGGTVQLSSTSFGQGTYMLQGGSLLTGGLLQIRFPGTFTWSGGTLGTSTVDLQAGLMQLTAASHRVLRTNELTVSGSGKLDLTDNSGILDYTGATPAASIRSLIITGRAGGAWTGNGITSSSAAAAASSAHKTAVGYAEASDLFTTFPATFIGQSVDSTSLLMRYVFAGDANLSGTVDSVDFNLLVSSFSQTGKAWFNGDFNYDTTVDSVDFNLLVSNFGQMLPAEAGRLAAAIVPEPALCTTTFLLMLRRRRR